jgi:hypothetical protein
MTILSKVFKYKKAVSRHLAGLDISWFEGAEMKGFYARYLLHE